MKETKFKYDKKEFKEKARQLAVKHNVPIEIMELWLDESYRDIEQNFTDQLKGKKKKKVEKMPVGEEWICPFCGAINNKKQCSGCEAYLEKKKEK